MSINLLMVSAFALSREFRKPLSTATICSNSATNVALVFTTFFTFSFFIFSSLTMDTIIRTFFKMSTEKSNFLQKLYPQVIHSASRRFYHTLIILSIIFFDFCKLFWQGMSSTSTRTSPCLCGFSKGFQRACADSAVSKRC